jgi:hypothetical protein
MTGMTPRHIGLLAQAAEVRCSPDGSAVAFTVVSVDLGRERPPQPYLAGRSRRHLGAVPVHRREGRDLLPAGRLTVGA